MASISYYWPYFSTAFGENIGSVFEWLDNHNGFVQAFATVVLITITFRSIREAENTRKDSRLPIIKFNIEGPYNYGQEGQSLRYTVENIGYGLALDVNLNFVFSGMESESFENIEMGESKTIDRVITKEKIESLKGISKMRDIATISYKDIFDRRLTTLSTIADEYVYYDKTQPAFKTTSWRVNLPK